MKNSLYVLHLSKEIIFASKREKEFIVTKISESNAKEYERRSPAKVADVVSRNTYKKILFHSFILKKKFTHKEIATMLTKKEIKVRVNVNH